ncbi:MAG TPA: MFS transporter [Burkholderiales bacterium]
MSAAGGVQAGLPARTTLSVALPFAFAYFLSYVYRSINAVISPDLIAGFSLSAADLGLLTSAYFLAFASCQIPLGILLDRFGPRRVNASLFVVAAAGALIFSLSQSFTTLLAGRALIGLGVSAGLMSSIKVFTIWFPMERLPAITGRILFVGGLGAMAATVPVESLLGITDWRGVFRIMSLLTLAAALALYFVVPERDSVRRSETWGEQARGVARVFRAGVFWRVAAGSAVFQAINMAVQGLWAGPWLMDVAGLDRNAVAGHLLALAAATMIGFLGWGLAAFRLARLGISTLVLFKTGTALFIVVQVLLALGVTTGAGALWVAFGLFGTASSLSFSILSQAFPVTMTGRANTALNLIVFSSAFAVQWLFGAVVGLWPGESGHYHPDGYRAAFVLLLVLEVAAFGWLMIATRTLKSAAAVS